MFNKEGEYIMKQIPIRLECAYCLRNSSHGGECSGKPSHNDEKGCLVFKVDTRGCIRSGCFSIGFPLYYEFLPLKTWWKNWQINNVETEIKINKIHGLNWDTKKGELIVHCDLEYFVNEYHEEYIEPVKKSHLKLIK